MQAMNSTPYSDEEERAPRPAKAEARIRPQEETTDEMRAALGPTAEQWLDTQPMVWGLE